MVRVEIPVERFVDMLFLMLMVLAGVHEVSLIPVPLTVQMSISDCPSSTSSKSGSALIITDVREVEGTVKEESLLETVMYSKELNLTLTHTHAHMNG